MKKAYQIDERKAINRFRYYINTNPGNIQMVLPLADLAQRLRHGVSQMLFDTERDLLMLIMSEEVNWLSQEHGNGDGKHDLVFAVQQISGAV